MSPARPLPKEEEAKAALSGASPDFFDATEQVLARQFLEKGIVRVPAEDRPALDRMRDFLADTAAGWLQQPMPKDKGVFLDHIHHHVIPDKLNDLRLALLNAMKQEKWLRAAYFSIGKRALEIIVGNELVMQRNVNLSIQLPRDDSSLLPLHSDVWSGDSPYEIVLWIPFVNCYGTKAMYFCDPEIDRVTQANLKDFRDRSAEDIFQAIAKDVRFMDVGYGEVLLFTQNIMHGNRVNVEADTRWSTNCRFKSALSPYADKKLGEFFEPITLRPATRMGLRYRLPEGF